MISIEYTIVILQFSIKLIAFLRMRYRRDTASGVPTIEMSKNRDYSGLATRFNSTA